MQDFFDNIFALADIHGKWQPIRDFHLANKLKYKLDTKKNVMSKKPLIRIPYWKLNTLTIEDLLLK